ncbi:MAG: hypothetical protein R6U96_19310 [Promethearchaeia archaeon]
MIHEENTKVKIKLEKDMIFKHLNDYERLGNIYIDETLERKSDNLWGPDAASLLGLSILSCLSASFIFCLNKRKLNPDDLDGYAEVAFKKDEKGYKRIKEIKVKIKPMTEDPETLKRMKQCVREMRDGEMYFEKSCIVTPSVRDGININVNIEF